MNSSAFGNNRINGANEWNSGFTNCRPHASSREISTQAVVAGSRLVESSAGDCSVNREDSAPSGCSAEISMPWLDFQLRKGRISTNGNESVSQGLASFEGAFGPVALGYESDIDIGKCYSARLRLNAGLRRKYSGLTEGIACIWVLSRIHLPQSPAVPNSLLPGPSGKLPV